MNTAQKREIRAVEYRQRADAALALVDASALAHVREKHELAAATWLALAAMDERPASRPDAISTHPEGTSACTA